jgi:uncharacterized delta-60 repeat protein
MTMSIWLRRKLCKSALFATMLASYLISLPTAAQFTAGALDPSFGANGLVKFSSVQSSTVAAVATQSDGRIITAGICGTNPNENICVSRLTRNGQSVDTSFGINGFRTIDYNNGQDYAFAVTVDANDRIVIVGVCNGIGYGCVTRLTAAGAIDGSFGTGGRASPPPIIRTFAVRVLSDDTIVVAGECYVSGLYEFCVARLLDNGTIDPTFNGGATLSFQMSARGADLRSMAVAEDGSIFVTGYCNDGSATTINYKFCAAKVTAAGQLDVSFNGTGKKLWTLANQGRDASSKIGIAANGRIIVAGDCNVDTVPIFCASALTTTGALDTTFGAGSYVGLGLQFVAPPSSVTLAGMSMAGDGTILLAGWCVSHGHCFARMRANGAPDASFGRFGDLNVEPDPLATAAKTDMYAIFVDSRNRLLASGSCNRGGAFTSYQGCLARYELDPPPGERCSLDLDQDGAVFAQTDGLMWLRLMLGFRGTAVTQGAIGLPTTFPVRSTWPQIQAYLLDHCGIR